MTESTPVDVTTDHLLDGRVALTQPRKGYRVAIDPVFLAAVVPMRSGEHVLELGCGSAAAALCVATRVPGVHVTGLELQTEMLELARHNVQANGLGDVISIVEGDVASPPSALSPGSFDHVMTNPPYIPAGQGNPPPDPVKAMAMVESHAPLADWIELAVGMLKSGGTLSMIHRADRTGEIAEFMAQNFGRIVTCPLWPESTRQKPAKRVLVQGTKGDTGENQTTEGIVMHDETGAYTIAADRILRAGEALNL